MAEIINLRQVRKARARAEADKHADANRTKHGASKKNRKTAAAEKERAAHDLDQKRLDPRSLNKDGE